MEVNERILQLLKLLALARNLRKAIQEKLAPQIQVFEHVLASGLAGDLGDELAHKLVSEFVHEIENDTVDRTELNNKRWLISEGGFRDRHGSTLESVLLGMLESALKDLNEETMTNEAGHKLTLDLLPEPNFASFLIGATVHDESEEVEEAYEGFYRAFGLELNPELYRAENLEDVTIEDNLFQPLDNSKPMASDVPSQPKSKPGKWVPPKVRQSSVALFTTFSPKEVALNNWHSVLAYLYRRRARKHIMADAETTLDEKLSEYRRGTESAETDIPEGTMVTATLQLDGFDINPPSLTIGFYEDWHRFEFKVRVREGMLKKAVNGAITFTADGIIVAEIPISIYVAESVEEPETRQTTQRPYQAIFCSYSHQDKRIVERVEAVAKLFELEYLRDVTTLKSGQHWSDELLNMIERADIFQLFWSENAAGSEYVEKEWRHALQLMAGEQKPDTFIRPVCWVEPIHPTPPKELEHIHFAYRPELVESSGDSKPSAE